MLKADWFDPQINPKLAEFCRHYHLDVMPCRPQMPQHKGKVERAVSYVRDNALKGRSFQSLAEENAFLRRWEENIADKRIHGTTCKQIAARFAEERPHLQPLPPSLFPCYQEARRNVNRDSFGEVQRAFYEAPPEYIRDRCGCAGTAAACAFSMTASSRCKSTSAWSPASSAAFWVPAE